ncbi:hypothetical protein MK079_03950, partial [Candidatus Gracilibacteria bacterium]|nr:hypothetical protein [Candidatus Gracilibacteria bacterium]
NIESVDENWSGGSKGQGYIITGNSGDNSTGINAGTILNTGPSNNPAFDSARQLTLSNGEKIWDFIGNAWEIVKPLNLYILDDTTNELSIIGARSTNISQALQNNLISGLTYGVYTDWGNVTDINFSNMYGPRYSNSSEQGMGRVRLVNNSSIFYMVGGDYSDSYGDNENGLFSLLIAPNTNYSNVATRCAYSY